MNAVEEYKQRVAYRDSVVSFEDAVKKHPEALTGDAADEKNPLEHLFADGLYIRKIFMPAGQVIVSKIHKYNHPYFVLKGKVSVLTDTGVEKISAPHYGITTVGTKRVLNVIEDTIWITVHATDKTDLKEVEEEIIAKDFKDPQISQHDMELLLEDKS
jgi:hypothetical protein